MSKSKVLLVDDDPGFLRANVTNSGC